MQDGYDRNGHYTGARNSTRVIEGRPIKARTIEVVEKELHDLQMGYLDAMNPSVYVLPHEIVALSKRINEVEDELRKLKEAAK